MPGASICYEAEATNHAAAPPRVLVHRELVPRARASRLPSSIFKRNYDKRPPGNPAENTHRREINCYERQAGQKSGIQTPGISLSTLL